GFKEPRLEAGQVAFQRRADVGVDYGGTNAIVFLDLRQHLRRERNVDVRHDGAYGLGGCALVAPVAPAVQVADGNGLHVLALQGRDGCVERGAVERNLDSTVWPDALTHSEPALARDELNRRRLAQIVAI